MFKSKLKAKLKHIHTWDVDLDTFKPKAEEFFGFWVEAEIGPRNDNSKEIYQLLICTPDWIKNELLTTQTPSLLVRAILIVSKYDLTEIEKTIQNYLDKCTGENWDEISEKINRVAISEFEGYKE